MRDPKRIPEVLERVREIWEQYPDLRLGQLLFAAQHEVKPLMKDVFYLEDDDLVEGLKSLKEKTWTKKDG